VALPSGEGTFSQRMSIAQQQVTGLREMQIVPSSQRSFSSGIGFFYRINNNFNSDKLSAGKVDFAQSGEVVSGDQFTLLQVLE
jgi:hypothetical protein